MSEYIFGPFEGAGASVAGGSGLVPAPASGDNEKFLRGDGTWENVPTELPSAPSSNGTYYLQCSVSSGTATYSWVSIPAANGVSF